MVRTLKVLLDTSVLVAALVRAHPRHERCRAWLTRMQTGELEVVLAAHTLAELHAVLTTLPVTPRISPHTALRLAEDNHLRPRPAGKVEIVSLAVDDYLSVLDTASRRLLAGGVIYDALIARAAENAKVDQLVTLDADHFRRAWSPEPIRSASRRSRTTARATPSSSATSVPLASSRASRSFPGASSSHACGPGAS